MKTILVSGTLLLIGLFLCSTTTTAQVGVKAGIGFSDIVFSIEGQAPYLGYEVDHLSHNYPLFTYQFGVFGNIKLNNRFDFQPEILIIKQGINYDIDFLYQEVTYRMYLWYVQVPLPVQYKFSLKKKNQPNLFLGPYFSVNVRAKRITNYDGNSETNNMENVKPFDFGFVAGFGYDFNLRSRQIVTELRVDYSLINMMNTTDLHIPYYDEPENLKARNISFILMVGYRFDQLFKKNKAK